MGFKLKINKPNDKDSINLVMGILKKNGCSIIGDLNTVDTYSPFDISGVTSDGLPFCAEVKDKACKHDTYGDVMCDLAKVKKYQESPLYLKMLVFNKFSDGYMGIGNPDAGYQVIKRQTPITTEFSEKGTEVQELASMKQLRLIKV